MNQPFPSGAIYSRGRRRLALRNQFNVISALFFREAEMRHGHSFTLGYLATGVEPLIIIGTIGLLFSTLTRAPAYGGNLWLFLGTGVFPIYLFIHTSMRMRQPLNPGAQRLRFPIERPFDHMAVHAILHMFSSTLVTVLFFGTLYYFGGVEQAVPENPLMAIEALGAVLFLGIAMGICNSIIGRLFPIWDILWPAIARGALHFSGIYFVAAYLSPDKRYYFAFNPMLHGVNWFRRAFYPLYPAELNDHLYLLSVAFSVLFVGLLLESGTRRFLEEME